MGFVNGRGRARCPPPISLDIHLAEDLSKEGFSDLVLELFRFLLQQRQQIPLPYSTLLQDISNHKREEEEEEESLEGISAKEKRERIRKRKEKSRFLKKADKFSSQMENLSNDLRLEITEKDLVTATLFFGATPVTPKEVYHVHFPPLSSNSGSSLTPKVKRQIFRSLVTHEELFTLLGRPLPLTNIYTALKYKYVQLPSNEEAFRPKPMFIKGAHKGHVVNYNFILPHTLSTPGTNMKRKRQFPRYTPVPMDLCTPFTITKSRRKHVLSSSFKPLPTQTIKRLQADFKSSFNLPLGEEDEETECEQDFLEGLSPLHEDVSLQILEEFIEEEEEEEEDSGISKSMFTPSSVNSIIDSHQEKWFVSSTHLKGIKL